MLLDEEGGAEKGVLNKEDSALACSDSVLCCDDGG